jgi:hypothetical protein
MERVHQSSRVATGGRLADHFIAGDALDELPMHGDGHEVVVHDEGSDHEAALTSA